MKDWRWKWMRGEWVGLDEGLEAEMDEKEGVGLDEELETEMDEK